MFRAWGLGCRVWGLLFGASEFSVQDFGLDAFGEGFGCVRFADRKFQTLGSGAPILVVCGIGNTTFTP